MEFTGERYVPSLDGQIKYEHLHRYALCLEFVTGKSVLDIASGEGYGSALLARVAESVVGVDISPEVVEYAVQQYSSFQNLKFLVGSCDSVPLADNSVEVVTSFETIEHHDQHEEMMLEIKRVLTSDGVLILSSPNRLTYSDEPKYSNPFHIKELYYEELVNLLSKHFKYFQIYGQRLATGSFIFSLENYKESIFKAYTGGVNHVDTKVCSLESPLYFVAICSDEKAITEKSIDSVYIDKADDLLKIFYTELKHSYFEREQTQVELERSQSQWQRTQVELEQSQSQWQRTQVELEQSQSQLQHTQVELEQSQSQLQHTQVELEQFQSQLQHTQVELEQFQSQLQQTGMEVEKSQSQLQQIQVESERSLSSLKQTQAELEGAIETITAMKSSKFWKMRTVWLNFKKLIKIQGEN